MLELIQRLLFGRSDHADTVSAIEPSLTPCVHCGRGVKLNQIVRSAYHVVGCAFCYSSKEQAA